MYARAFGKPTGSFWKWPRCFRSALEERCGIFTFHRLPLIFRLPAVWHWGLCWKAGVAAEVIGIPGGSIGEKLYHAKIYLNTPDLFAWTIVIIGISVLFEKLFLTGIGTLVERMGK